MGRILNTEYTNPHTVANEMDELMVARVNEIAKKRGVSMAMIALAWCFKKHVYPITGMHSLARV